jgi:O-antigen ligase
LTRIFVSQKNKQNIITNPILKKYLLPILGVIIAFIAIFGIWQFNTPKFQSLLDMNNRNSITTRVQIWDTSIAMIIDNPVLGIGLADFQRVYAETIPAKYFPPYEWLVPEPHNLYFAFWLHLGLAGIIWLIYILRYTIIRLIESIKSNQWETYWLSLSLLSIFLYGILDTPFWKNDLALVFLVILYGVVGKRKKP